MADPKALTRRFYDEVVNQGKLEVIDELLAPDFVEHEELPGLTNDREGVKKFFALFKAGFPDGRFEVQDMIMEGDKIVIRVTIHGTHQGEFLGIPATGRQIRVQAIDILQIRDDQAIAHWGVLELATMLTQLGVMPAPEGARV